MKLEVERTKKEEIDIAAIRCELAVRYEEQDIPNDYPHRRGDVWDITIDVETGKIRDWPQGLAPRNVYMKVCDQGTYSLLDASGAVIERVDEDYVPSCIPGEYGDYVDFKIDGFGRIANWSKDRFASRVEGCFFAHAD